MAHVTLTLAVLLQVTVLPPPTSPDMNLPALRLLDLSTTA